MSDDLMDELRNAVAEARASEGASDGGGDVVEAGGAAGGADSGLVDAGEPSIADAPDAGGDDGEPSGSGVRQESARARGPDGKFAKAADLPKGSESKAPAQSATKAPVKPTLSVVKSPAQAPQPDPKPPLDGVATAPVQGSTPEVRAPQGWTAPEREAFAKAPPELQQAMVRREKEYHQGIEKSALGAKEWSRAEQVIAPHRAMIGNADPIQVVGNLLQAAHTLNYAPPQAKAQFLARMIKDSGVPIELLDSALSGQPAPEQAQHQQPVIDQRAITAQIEAVMHMERLRMQAEAFGKDRPFFEKLKPRMAALLRDGFAQDLDSAYDQAREADPEVRAAIRQQEAEDAQRERARRANEGPNGPASTQRARIAGSSVKSQPAPAPPGRQADQTEDILREEMAKARRG